MLPLLPVGPIFVPIFVKLCPVGSLAYSEEAPSPVASDFTIPA